MMFFMSRKWRVPRVILGLIIFEFPLTVACLTLTGIAAPNLYRNKLWQTGGDLGFNSKPITIVYAYANYRPVDIPLVWSQFSTNFNLVISVLSMFLLLTKMTMHILGTFYPVMSLIVHGLLVGLWSYSVHVQTAPDTIDRNRINNGVPWYISKSCNVAPEGEVRGYCMQAKGFFAMTIVSLLLFSTHFILALWSAIPTEDQKAARRTKIEEKKMFSPGSGSDFSAEDAWQRQWEMGQIPSTPGTTGGIKSPFTPRTQAFHNLGGGMDQTEHTQPRASGLPLRERFGEFYRQ
ncbi:hypothetical protein EJ05DRAFT_466858 [Pseudovirgaria hyperparasitica]|uniref:MARVEL domain-containing protein n=1 Tax=Pseudovirgaria hyperparasitica TaxID=470096 RepID=A0A6A6W4K8_9PEZI|nr:uncharacterized protein EJ05DRAFT_466858 [Pseudovirgaria hyperparasitica]KAF2756497.1 hypothetical protein EJ05DRAFT_466858 [Pseudovirgaria hyperparasitica]